MSYNESFVANRTKYAPFVKGEAIVVTVKFIDEIKATSTQPSKEHTNVRYRGGGVYRAFSPPNNFQNVLKIISKIALLFVFSMLTPPSLTNVSSIHKRIYNSEIYLLPRERS